MATHQIAQTKNVRRFMGALHDLQHRPPGVEGMAILWGKPGEGKSTTITHAALETRGTFIRASAAWTMTSMLKALLRELRQPTGTRRADMVERAVEVLAMDPVPVFVDEADYLLRDGGVMLDVLRDIYDLSGAPVVLIGMEEFANRLTGFGGGRFRRRISQWVEFAGLDLSDTALVVKTITDIPVEDDLLRHIHEACEGNVGRIVIGASRVQAFARHNGFGSVSLEQFGRQRALFLDVKGPRSRRRNG